MAEFLIKNFNDQGIDGARELVGDIVEVRPDGAPYGTKEREAGRFLVIKCPGLPLAEAIHLMEPLQDNTDPERPVTIRRRRYSVAQALAFLGPYHTEGNIYTIPPASQAGQFVARIADKAT